MTSSIQGVIFDYGSTLMQFGTKFGEVDPHANQAIIDRLIADGVSMERETFLPVFQSALDQNDLRRKREWREIPTQHILLGALEQVGLAHISRAIVLQAMEAFYSEYEKHWHLYPESKAVLDWLRLRNIRIGMITNAGDAENIRRLLSGHEIASYFDPVVVSSLEGVRKPDPSLFQKVMAAWNLPAASLVMVGDQLGMDVLGAQKVGMRSIWMRTELEMPANQSDRGSILADAEADSIGEIPGILERWELARGVGDS
jgi:HAD superfamily hydrolase (TIGR01549 family)